MIQDVVMPLDNPLKAVSIAEFCASIRAREGITQSDMAMMVGINRTSVAKAETGIVERPYDYLKYILKWMNEREIAHMLELLRAIDLKHLDARLESKHDTKKQEDV